MAVQDKGRGRRREQAAGVGWRQRSGHRGCKRVLRSKHRAFDRAVCFCELQPASSDSLSCGALTCRCKQGKAADAQHGDAMEPRDLGAGLTNARQARLGFVGPHPP